MKQKKSLTIKSISYVHDPDAAKKWFDLYLEMMKKQLIKESAKSTD